MDNEAVNQKVYISDRQRIELSGILDVTSFSEYEIEAEYKGGYISVEGENLKMDGFSSETGALSVNGLITGLYYFNKLKPFKKRSSKKDK